MLTPASYEFGYGLSYTKWAYSGAKGVSFGFATALRSALILHLAEMAHSRRMEQPRVVVADPRLALRAGVRGLIPRQERGRARRPRRAASVPRLPR